MKAVEVTGIEKIFEPDELIVSKTDLKGRITYANQLFLQLSGYNEEDLMGAPHSILRHPDMPRCVFKLLWDTVASGKEIFAYVVNRCANGDHYWVFAHVTPSFDLETGKIIGYHSNRRMPNRQIISDEIIPLYKMLKQIEDSHKNKKEGMHAAFNKLISILEEKGVGYDEFIFSL